MMRKAPYVGKEATTHASCPVFVPTNLSFCPWKPHGGPNSESPVTQMGMKLPLSGGSFSAQPSSSSVTILRGSPRTF